MDLSFLQKEMLENVTDYSSGWIQENNSVKKKDVLIQKELLTNEIEDTNWSAELEAAHEDSAQNSWIDVYERDRVLEELSFVMNRRGLLLIEFGSSTGYMIQEIKNKYPGNELIATDLFIEGLHKSFIRNPDIMHIQCDNISAPFIDNSMDVLVSLNVLEHIEDDEKALSECYRILKKGGVAIIVVPRGDKLYDYYDEALYHKRRYADGEIRYKCEKAGFHVVDDNHLAALIYPAFWIKKKMNRLKWKKGISYKASVQETEKDIDNVKDSKIAKIICGIEAAIYRKHRFKHGIREIIVIKKV